MPDRVDALLKQHFGHEVFRPRQRAIIDDVVAGRDAFVILPTGGGKSLCYQLPALVDEVEGNDGASGTTVVVSPLIALMHNQVEALNAHGIPATFLNSTLDSRELNDREQKALDGKYRLLYLAPERLMSGAGRNLLMRLNVARFAIDEAHCISEWGHDFRPEYRMLGQLRTRFDGRFARTPIVALTATATPRVADDIVRELQLRDTAIHRGGFERTNLHYEVRPKQRVVEQIIDHMKRNPMHEGIVYCLSRRRCEEVAGALAEAGIDALPYHAGLDGAVRERNQHAFIYGDAKVVCATIAFGMGVDKPDVRFVFHADLPRHIEGYYQETGRAGRDGLPADCVLFYSGGDRGRLEFFINQKETEAERQHAREQLDQVVKYAHTLGCRTAALVAHFGDKLMADDGKCGHCDNCVKPPAFDDVTESARKLLSAIVRTDQRFGLSHVINVLRGSEAEKVLSRNHHKLSVHGIGKDRPTGFWRQLAEHLTQAGQLASTKDEYRTVYLTPESKAVLKGDEKVLLPRSRAAKVGGNSGGNAGGGSGGISGGGGHLRNRSTPAVGGPVDDDGPPIDDALFQRLRNLRRDIAAEQGVPPYVVFGDLTLRQMARQHPTSDDDLIHISGVGQTKLERYGPKFLDAIREHAAH